ncbi:MAG: ABC transporter permease [Desulfobacteraceae bacterium]
MNLKRMWSMIVARNREFFRDRAAFGWNFLFPFLLIGGFAIIFGGQEHKDFQVGLFPCESRIVDSRSPCLPEVFSSIKHIRYIGFNSNEEGLTKLKHHKIDLLVDVSATPNRYWVSDTSPKGYIVEKMINASLLSENRPQMDRQKEVAGRQIRYIDWLFPGILGMNIMFSALYGVGFVVVRYRKTGVLKRLKATPLRAFEYLSAQMISRLFLLMFTLVILWVGCDMVFDFRVEGSYGDLFIIFLLGCLSLTSMGLIVASRGSSEEFANGVLNFVTWPMMFLSEVWFSIEGAPQWVKRVAELFPLTHLLSGVRKIMNDGAGLMDVGYELTALTVMTLAFLLIGAMLFSWNK